MFAHKIEGRKCRGLGGRAPKILINNDALYFGCKCDRRPIYVVISMF